MAKRELLESFQIVRNVPEQLLIFPENAITPDRRNNAYHYGTIAKKRKARPDTDEPFVTKA